MASSAALTFGWLFSATILAAIAARPDSPLAALGLFKLILSGLTVWTGDWAPVLSVELFWRTVGVVVGVGVLVFVSVAPILSLSFGSRGWSEDGAGWCFVSEEGAFSDASADCDYV